MKYPILLLAFFVRIQLSGQIAFEENFEDKTTGLDLTTQGYQIW